MSLIDAIKTGETTLEGFGVVSENVRLFIRKIESLGGAAKILGGGGKTDNAGFLLCYHADRPRIDAVAREAGYKTQSISLGEEGIRLEKKI